MAYMNWQSEFDPWARAADSIGKHLATTPMIRAQIAERNARMATEAAQARHYDAQTEKTRAETEGVTQDNAGHTQIAGGLRKLSTNPQDKDAIADVFEGVGKSFRKDPQGTAKGIGVILGQINALNGNVKMGAEVTDPVRMQMSREKPMVVPQGSRVIQQGEPGMWDDIAAGDFTLNPGQQRFTGSVKPPTTPAAPIATAPPNPLPPKSSALEQERARFISRLNAMREDAMTPEQKKKALAEFDLQTGYTRTGSTGVTEEQIRNLNKVGKVDPRSARNMIELLAGSGMAANPMATNATTAVPVSGTATPTPAEVKPRPTRAQARQYVNQFGTNATLKLQQDGFDTTGYAD